MTARDYSAMGDAAGRCRVCGHDLWPDDGDFDESGQRYIDRHTTQHLADGTAVVVVEFGHPERVVPTASLPMRDTADDPAPTPRTLTRSKIARLAQKMRAVRSHSYRP